MARNLFEKYIGLPIEDVKSQLENLGQKYRIFSVDNKPVFGDCRRDMSRMNLTVKDGKVIQISLG